MLHKPPTNYHLLAAKQEPHQNADLLTINTEEFPANMKNVGNRGSFLIFNVLSTEEDIPESSDPK